MDGAVLYHNASVHLRAVDRVCLVGIVGVDCVGVVGAQNEGAGESPQQPVVVPGQRSADPSDHIDEKCGICALPCAGADLLIVDFTGAAGSMRMSFCIWACNDYLRESDVLPEVSISL